MLGQKKSRDDSLHTTTATEFFSAYPQLLEYMSHHIQQAVGAEETGRLSLHPCLFPVLAILAKLSPGGGSTETGDTKLVTY